MNITEHQQGDITIFKINGRVDTSSAAEMDSVLQTALEAGKYKIALDLAELRYISSAGLRTFADVLTQNKNAGGDLKLVSVNPKIMRILQIIGFDQFFNIHDTMDEAIAAF